MLLARLDRLPGTARRLLQAAAVIGKDIALPLLQAITDVPEETLQRGLAYLQTAEFLYGTGLVPEPHYNVQACPDSGSHLSVVAAEDTSAVPWTHCAGAGGTISGSGRSTAFGADPESCASPMSP